MTVGRIQKFHMGNTGEIAAEKYRVSRERQDEYALNSHRKAVDAIRNGRSGRNRTRADTSNTAMPSCSTPMKAQDPIRPLRRRALDRIQEGWHGDCGNAPL
jgi:acetyl-CoA acetyltransferase